MVKSIRLTQKKKKERNHLLIKAAPNDAIAIMLFYNYNYNYFSQVLVYEFCLIHVYNKMEMRTINSTIQHLMQRNYPKSVFRIFSYENIQ